MEDEGCSTHLGSTDQGSVAHRRKSTRLASGRRPVRARGDPRKGPARVREAPGRTHPTQAGVAKRHTHPVQGRTPPGMRVQLPRHHKPGYPNGRGTRLRPVTVSVRIRGQVLGKVIVRSLVQCMQTQIGSGDIRPKESPVTGRNGWPSTGRVWTVGRGTNRRLTTWTPAPRLTIGCGVGLSSAVQRNWPSAWFAATRVTWSRQQPTVFRLTERSAGTPTTSTRAGRSAVVAPTGSINRPVGPVHERPGPPGSVPPLRPRLMEGRRPRPGPPLLRPQRQGEPREGVLRVQPGVQQASLSLWEPSSLVTTMLPGPIPGGGSTKDQEGTRERLASHRHLRWRPHG